MMQSGIEPATFKLVAQCLNQYDFILCGGWKMYLRLSVHHRGGWKQIAKNAVGNVIPVFSLCCYVCMYVCIQCAYTHEENYKQILQSVMGGAHIRSRCV
jgi:hypothetical protein